MATKALRPFDFVLRKRFIEVDGFGFEELLA
jgi:hypothetical protein